MLRWDCCLALQTAAGQWQAPAFIILIRQEIAILANHTILLATASCHRSSQFLLMFQHQGFAEFARNILDAQGMTEVVALILVAIMLSENGQLSLIFNPLFTKLKRPPK